MAGDRESDQTTDQTNQIDSSAANEVIEEENNLDGDPNRSNEGSDVEEEEDSDFEALDRQLDQLSSYLDVLEEKNDVLIAQLRDLLESNRQARMELNSLQRNSNSPENNEDKSDKPSGSSC